jgi:hypothetical protein
VRMAQPGGNLNFPQEAVGAKRGRNFRKQDFERDQAIVPKVPAKVHRRHSPPTEFPLEGVMPMQRGSEFLNEIFHSTLFQGDGSLDVQIGAQFRYLEAGPGQHGSRTIELS